MSLLDEAREACTMLTQQGGDDGYGGGDDGWSDGESFYASFALDNSVEAMKASADGVNNFYSVFTARDFPLTHGDVFRRESDGKTFRVTSDGYDNRTPQSAFLKLSVVTAEMWEVPDYG